MSHSRSLVKVGSSARARVDARASLSGILSLNQKLTFDLELIGHGEVTNERCGEWLMRKKLGCLDVAAHNKVLNTEYHGKIALKLVRYWCHKPDCPVCHESWVTRVKEIVTWRTKKYGQKIQQRPIHVILSPPIQQLTKIKSVDGLFRKAKEICREYNINAGSLVYHSKSRACDHCGAHMKPRKNRCHNCGKFGWHWKFNPHFHFFGFGWLPKWETKDGTISGKELYHKYQWVVKNLKIRKTVSGTVWYELSHCAFLGRKAHHIRWIGDISPNKFTVPPLRKEKPKCPICNQEMRPVCYTGDLETIEKREEIQFLEPKGWYYKGEPPPK